jgi:Outer membrane protein beta-barrel domain
MQKSKILLSLLILTTVKIYGQAPKLQVGIQTGFAIPMGSFASGFNLYVDNGYASTGQNYKIYAEYRILNNFCVGLNYLYYANGLEDGNLRTASNNIYTTNKATYPKYSSTQGLIASLLFKGKEAPLFIKGFGGLGVSKTAEIEISNNKQALIFPQATSNLGAIIGLGAGIYLPIKDKWCIEIEADYISSFAKPENVITTDKSGSVVFPEGNISYNQTVVNINVGIGFFFLND